MPTDMYRAQVTEAVGVGMPMEIARLAAFLKEQPQVGNLNTINVLMFNLVVQNKLFIRQLAK